MSNSKTGLPVSPKHAAVKIDSEQLELVSKIVACRLNKIGYNEPSKYYYVGDEVAMGNTPKQDGVLSVRAPFLYEVKKWLEKFNVVINVYCKTERVEVEGEEHYRYVSTGEWVRVIYTKENGKMVQYKRPINTFISESDALTIAIREGVYYVTKMFYKSNDKE